MKTRVSVYVDGFNLYHAIDALKQPHLKWLDLWALSETLVRKDECVEIVKYFSAYAKWIEDKYRRHQRYVSALEARGIKVYMGRFKEKGTRCKKCKREWHTHEEKETDVNIGAHLMADALRDRFDRALIVSADTDLNGAVELAKVELAKDEAPQKQIDIVAPPGRRGRNSNAQFGITKGQVRQSLLPAELTSSNGKTIRRPDEYAPPEPPCP